MSYNSQTPNLGLPQWILSDPPQMSDFNTAFSRIDDFAEPLVKSQKGEISVSAAAQAAGLCFNKGATFDIGRYIASGYVTTGGTTFQCTIILPFIVSSSVSNVTLNGNLRIRQAGNYLAGSGSSGANLSGLEITTTINGGYAITFITTSISGNINNNDTASALFENLSITFN